MLNNKIVTIGTIITLMIGCAIAGRSSRPVTVPKNTPEFAKVAVMITDRGHRNGGTGSILDSRAGETRILTNKHICNLIQTGGIVTTDTGEEYPIHSFVPYPRHDLCMVTVLKNLGINLKVASAAPVMYSSSTVVGHPALLPTVITNGHFSQHRVISMVVGGQPCTGKEDDEDTLMCIFSGQKPVIQDFYAQLTTSLIMPGSSGSAIFNDQGELSGVVFAGSEALSYGFIVPLEYVQDFIRTYSKYKKLTPNPLKEPDNYFLKYFQLEAACKAGRQEFTEFCSKITFWGIYHE